MQLTHLATLSLILPALARPGVHNKRTAAQIETDIATISTQLTSFDSSINSFTGSLLQALSLLTSYTSLASAITTATTAVTSTGTLSASDSATIEAAVDSLASKITDTLSDADAKFSVVESAGYATEVCEALASLETDADAFFTALEGTIDSAYTSEISTLQSTVDAAFSSTTTTYGC